MRTRIFNTLFVQIMLSCMSEINIDRSKEIRQSFSVQRNSRIMCTYITCIIHVNSMTKH